MAANAAGSDAADRIDASNDSLTFTAVSGVPSGEADIGAQREHEPGRAIAPLPTSRTARARGGRSDRSRAASRRPLAPISTSSLIVPAAGSTATIGLAIATTRRPPVGTWSSRSSSPAAASIRADSSRYALAWSYSPTRLASVAASDRSCLRVSVSPAGAGDRQARVDHRTSHLVGLSRLPRGLGREHEAPRGGAVVSLLLLEDPRRRRRLPERAVSRSPAIRCARASSSARVAFE